MKICPSCGGPGFVLGDLGQLRWFRCRNCGQQFSSRLAPKKPRLTRPDTTLRSAPSDQRPQTKNEEP